MQNDSSQQTPVRLDRQLSGTLFDLPGGPLGLAVGVEYRKLKGRFDPDPVVAAGFSSDIPAQPTRGSYDVKEAYAELNAPLLSDVPFIDLLELNGAVRVSDYSTSGFDDHLQGRRQLEADRGPSPARHLCGRLPRSVHRRTVRHAIALRRSRSTIPARRTPATWRRDASRMTRRSGPPASRPAFRPMAATSRPTPRSR